MTDIAALREYLPSHYPALIEAGDADGIYADMQSSGGTTTGSITWAKFMMWLAGSGIRAVIEDIAADSQHPLRSSALILKDFLVGAAATFDLSDPDNAAFLDGWVQAGAITSDQAASLLALAQRPITIAERDGFAGLTLVDIKQAIWFDDGERAI